MTTVEAAFNGERITVWLNGHRLRALWTVVAVVGAVIAWDWRRGSGL